MTTPDVDRFMGLLAGHEPIIVQDGHHRAHCGELEGGGALYLPNLNHSVMLVKEVCADVAPAIKSACASNIKVPPLIDAEVDGDCQGSPPGPSVLHCGIFSPPYRPVPTA